MAEPIAGSAGPSRVAVVTGGGRGLGRAMALGLAEHGVAVGQIGRSPETLQTTASQCAERGVPTAVAAADVRDSDAVRAALDRLASRLGPCDLLVNNAGRMDAEETGFASADVDDVLAVIDVNLLGVMRVTHAVLSSMRQERRGRILNVNSGFAFRRDSVDTGYAVSKAALARLTDLLAHQSAADGIVVLDASPGLVRTDMTASMPMWQTDDVAWGDARDMVGLVTAFADGRLDAISGRFVHAAKDDLGTLLDILPADRDARTLGLRTYGDADPLA